MVDHHKELINLFMSNFLSTPGFFKRYKRGNIYPVVIGGIDLMRCCHGQGDTSDIDIKFVVDANITSVDDPLFKLADAIRGQFLDELVQMANNSKLLGPTTSLSIVRETQVVASISRVVIYEETNGKKQVLIDTGLHTTVIQEKSLLDHFENFFDGKFKNGGIPIYYKNNIPFATCTWTLIDTVRMMIVSRHYMENISKEKNKKFWKNKYIKYSAKFVLLHRNQLASKTSKKDKEVLNNAYIVARDSNEDIYEILKLHTNIESVEKRFQELPKVDTCYKLILDFVLKNVLKKYFKNYVNDKFYPVIIGGVDVNKCVSPHFNIKVKDIDIQFILVDESVEDKAVLAKQSLVRDILTDRELASYLLQLQNEYGMTINIEEFAEWEDGNHQLQLDMYLSIIQVVFTEVNSDILIQKTNMSDIIVLNRKIQDFSGKPIPYIESDGILFGTCKWVFENTYYMLNLYADFLKKEVKSKAINKYLRYVCKYAALFMALNSHTISYDDMKKLRKLYNLLSHIIKGSIIRSFDLDKKTENTVDSILKMIINSSMQKSQSVV